MNPKDLKSPYRFEERRPLFQEPVFFVPEHYGEYDAFEFHHPESLHIEFCSGNGDWVVEKAKQNPHQFWIAVEMRFDRVRKIWSKIQNRGLKNLWVVCGEAWTFAKHYVQSRCVEEIYINFPDPWPKNKHAKHRLMQERFLDEIARILKREGTLTFVTDDTDYLERTTALFGQHQKFKLTEKDCSNYGSSYFDTLWRDKGKEINYVSYAMHEDLQRV